MLDLEEIFKNLFTILSDLKPNLLFKYYSNYSIELADFDHLFNYFLNLIPLIIKVIMLYCSEI